MSGRQIFSEAEKLCLQELIIKYKLNTASTLTASNTGVRKIAWARLVEEFNSIESNNKRTEQQLKKCWDNLKTRKKSLLAQENKERMRTGGGNYEPKPGSSNEDPMLIDEALLEQTDVEIQYVIDSDNLPNEELLYPDVTSENLPVSDAPENASLEVTDITNNTERDDRDKYSRSGSRHTDYSASGPQTPGAKNIRSKVITEEFQIRKKNYERIKEREEELHANGGRETVPCEGC